MTGSPRERQFGPYRLVRQIAVGGMAEIHLAKTKGIAGFEKYVALKMIHPNFAEDEQFIQMLVDEAKIAVQLTHGNIAQTFDLGRVGETYYITMEYVDGADLYKILRRGSEQDIEMPLDVCAFVAKEVTSALDHAHRKKDHAGRSLGIVHRDVSPQNVLVSFSGEVKLVDFGIAKATMKAKQTAVGVIKGKYYYMSPEQARGDRIDYRSDIFSAGIVLYEMITEQMLYLEEDLHKLLEMARKADIAPPSKLRKGVPPQLERIVMHALAKDAEERYQSAGDFASDLERFLHAYSPVFTSGKLSNLVKQIVGEPQPVPMVQDHPSIEIRDGVMSTHTIDDTDLAHAKDELRDENSVIFRVDELKKAAPAPAVTAKVVAPPLAAPRAAPSKTEQPTAPLKTRSKIPSIIPKIVKPTLAAAPGPAAVAAPPPIVPSLPAEKPPRQIDEDTRRLDGPPPGMNEDSGLLPVSIPKKITPGGWDDGGETENQDDLGERTMISAPPGMAGATVTGTTGGASGFMLEDSVGDGADSIDATVITLEPKPDTDTHTGLRPADVEDGHETAEVEPPDDVPDDDEGPTLAREFPNRSRTPTGRSAPNPALAAKIHAPAVSELRRPRASRRTPPGGVPAQSNVLQSLVGSPSNEPMPAPRPGRTQPPPMPLPPQPQAQPRAATPPHGSQGSGPPPSQYPQQPYPPSPPFAGNANHQMGFDASGLPIGLPTPPSGIPVAPTAAGYMQQPGSAPPYQHAYGVNPQALYQFQPQGQPVPQRMSLTGQMRLFEVDEIPSQYKLGGARWFWYLVGGVIAVSVAASATFFIIRTTREPGPAIGSVHIESVPPGAEVTFDGTRLTDKTPVTVDGVPIGTRHDVRVELARHKAYIDTVDMPKTGGEVPVMARLKPITGKLKINSIPGGAEIRINDQVRGRTPTTIGDVDMDSARHIEVRLKDYQPFVQDLTWPASGEIDLDVKLTR